MVLTVAVSSRALFHMEDGHKIFVTEGGEAFDAYMRSKETVPLRPGVAFPLVKKLLALNTTRPPDWPDRVDVVLLSRNSPDAGLRVMNSIQHYGLDIQRAVFSHGMDRFRYARALGTTLFLSANAEDVASAIGLGVAAARVIPKELGEEVDDSVVRIAFDGDSVLFGDEADRTYRTHGVREHRRQEMEKAQIPLPEGPFSGVLRALVELQQTFPANQRPVRIALVTARGIPAHERVIQTLRSWGLEVDEAIFCAGLPKGPLLHAFGADIFFDDTMTNVDNAHEHGVLGAHVPVGQGGIVRA
jgi:5'-nucleotidase